MRSRWVRLAATVGLSVVVLAGGMSSARAAPGDIDVCGSLSYFSRATATTNNVLSLATAGGLVNYQLVLSGTFPEDLGARSTALFPEIVRLVGRPVQGINTVADYTVTRVGSCTLPTTSTAPDSAPRTPLAMLIVLVIALGAALLAMAGRVRTAGSP